MQAGNNSNNDKKIHLVLLGVQVTSASHLVAPCPGTDAVMTQQEDYHLLQHPLQFLLEIFNPATCLGWLN